MGSNCSSELTAEAQDKCNETYKAQLTNVFTFASFMSFMVLWIIFRKKPLLFIGIGCLLYTLYNIYFVINI